MVPITIKNFPMPPSANALYANARWGGRHKTKAYSEYEAEIKYWAIKNSYQLQNARIIMQQRQPDEVFHVERIYYFQAKDVLTLKGKPKRNDTTNRLKALDDTLAVLLGVDDSMFWDGSFKKRICTHSEFGRYVDIRINTISLKHLDD